jgi:HlyD family secretion protein
MKRKILFVAVSVIVLLLAAYFLYRYFGNPVFKSGDFQTARVDRGAVMRTVPARGVVEPGSEVLLLSPASSIIKEIHKEPGSRVEAGEVILVLDPNPIEEEIDAIRDQLKIMENNLQKNLLSARTIRVDLDYNIEVKKLTIASLKSELADQEQLLSVGGISPARFEKTKQELALAEKDLETITEKNSIRLKQLEADEAGLRLQIDLQEKDLMAKEELLSKMNIKAPSAGIILDLNGKKGEKVNTDRLLVRMSDLSAYKIIGSIDEKNAGVIQTGGSVYATIDGEELWGKIGTISPVVRNEKLEFDVYLEESNHQKLLPNLSVDMRVIIERKDSVLRIIKGPLFENGPSLETYRIQGNMAYLQPITIGLSGNTYIEILSGASEGDELIISSMPAFKNLKEVELQ